MEPYGYAQEVYKSEKRPLAARERFAETGLGTPGATVHRGRYEGGPRFLERYRLAAGHWPKEITR